MRAGDLKTIHWSTATVSWPSSFWMVMSPPKNSSENGDTSVQSYRKICEDTCGEFDNVEQRRRTNWVTRSALVMTRRARQPLCGVGSKCPIRGESLKCVSVPAVLGEMSSCPVCESHKFVTVFSIQFPPSASATAAHTEQLDCRSPEWKTLPKKTMLNTYFWQKFWQKCCKPKNKWYFT